MKDHGREDKQASDKEYAPDSNSMTVSEITSPPPTLNFGFCSPILLD